MRSKLFDANVEVDDGDSMAPTYADLQSAIAWSSSLRTRMVRMAGASALVGRGSAFQFAFEGDGFVVVQAEGPLVPGPERDDFRGRLWSTLQTSSIRAQEEP
jgi:uncharacterized protein (AIM24 family)